MSLKHSGGVTIRVAKQRFSFSAAHFLVHADTWEPLHGHDFRVVVKVTGDTEGSGFVVDFGVLKRLVKRVCERFDRRVLIPERSELLRIEESADEVVVHLGSSRYVFPAEEVVILPLVNTSVEQLALVVLEALAPRIMQLSASITRVEIELEESAGQAAAVAVDRGDIMELADEADPSDRDASVTRGTGMDDQSLLAEAVRLSLEASNAGESPFGAVVAIGGKLVGAGINRTTSSGDLTRHAELEAIAESSRAGDLGGAVLYTSCEPCPMCLFGAFYAGITRVVFGASMGQVLALDSGDPGVASSDVIALAGLGIELVQASSEDQDAIRVLRAHVDRYGHL